MAARGASPVHIVSHRLGGGEPLFETKTKYVPVRAAVTLPPITLAALPLDREDYFLGREMQKAARACGVLPPEETCESAA